ncbi:MAG: tetratricopeptide repeat protein [Gallionella sp.]
MLGLSRQMQGLYAIPALERAAELLPNDAEAHGNLSAALRACGQLDAAVASARRALQIRPDFAPWHNNLGVMLQDQGKMDEAAESYRRAIQIKPDFVEAHNNLGSVLQKLWQLDAALASCNRAIELKPDFAEAYNTLGAVLDARGQPDAALASYRRALEIKPDYAEALNNMGFMLKETGQFDDALTCIRRALEIKPDYAEAHNDLGFTLLLIGRFAEGWKEYWWHVRPQERRNYPIQRLPDNPLFNRKPDELLPVNLHGNRLTILGDQGLGDELFFLRFARELKKRGAWLAYATDPRLANMIHRAKLVDRVMEKGEVLGDTNAVILVSDLPLLLGMASEADIPPAVPLGALPEKRREITLRLASHRREKRPLIGVTWRAGGDKFKMQMVREIPPEQLAARLRGIEATFVAVQRNPAAGELAAFEAALGQPVPDFTDLNDDLEGMLALMEQLDDYIGVDNTNMHLRLSVGKSARMLVPHLRDFRCMAKGDGSPWFPGFAIYRKIPDKGWDDALDQLRNHIIQDY